MVCGYVIPFSKDLLYWRIAAGVLSFACIVVSIFQHCNYDNYIVRYNAIHHKSPNAYLSHSELELFKGFLNTSYYDFLSPALVMIAPGANVLYFKYSMILMTIFSILLKELLVVEVMFHFLYSILHEVFRAHISLTVFFLGYLIYRNNDYFEFYHAIINLERIQQPVPSSQDAVKMKSLVKSSVLSKEAHRETAL